MKSKIDVDNISALAHLKLTKEEKRLLEPQMIKINKSVLWEFKLWEIFFKNLGYLSLLFYLKRK